MNNSRQVWVGKSFFIGSKLAVILLLLSNGLPVHQLIDHWNLWPPHIRMHMIAFLQHIKTGLKDSGRRDIVIVVIGVVRTMLRLAVLHCSKPNCPIWFWFKGPGMKIKDLSKSFFLCAFSHSRNASDLSDNRIKVMLFVFCNYGTKWLSGDLQARHCDCD